MPIATVANPLPLVRADGRGYAYAGESADGFADRPELPVEARVRLARLAEDAQVVCVTHLAQIASYGDTHVALRKHVRGAVTAIEAVALSGEPRRIEVARMLSGDELGVALEHAAELLAARER